MTGFRLSVLFSLCPGFSFPQSQISSCVLAPGWITSRTAPRRRGEQDWLRYFAPCIIPFPWPIELICASGRANFRKNR
jgi:hypothetical protein